MLFKKFKTGIHLKNNTNTNGIIEIIFGLNLIKKIKKRIKHIKIKSFKYFLNLYCDKCIKFTQNESNNVTIIILITK